MQAGLRFIVAVSVWTCVASAKCVQIYYDRGPGDSVYGRTHALFAQNLIAHFPALQQMVLPIAGYRQGDLDRCEASLYLGTNYFSPVPAAFYDDFAATTRRVAWAGYNVWGLGAERLERIWKVRFRGLSPMPPVFSELTAAEKAAHAKPGFFKFYEYKGEEFFKYGEWDDEKSPKAFLAATEIVLLDVLPGGRDHVLSWARHSNTDEAVPYALRGGNRWYLGDSPFSFMTEEDRYLIFTDLLFDILDEKPRHPGKRPALLRVEDVHPEVPTWQLKRIFDTFAREKAPFSVSLVPVFTDPFGILRDRPQDRWRTMATSRDFVETLEKGRRQGASYILHGYTHQSGHRPNPFNGLTGDDFEFWDRVKNAPLEEESVAWGLDRLEDAVALIESANRRFGAKLEPIAWLTPHYQCSPLLCALFGQLWRWTVGRNIYFPHERAGKDLPTIYSLDVAGGIARAERRERLATLDLRYSRKAQPAGQFFPYEIYGDIYRQRVVPENVGNVQPYMNEQVHRTQSVDELLSIMRRNRVLRDAWASLFFHPFRVGTKAEEGVGEFPGDTRQLERLLRGARAYGYEWIDLGNWVRNAGTAMRPEPIERER